MSHRTARVWLEPGVPRCEPLHRPCPERETCARYLAALPPAGAVMGDYSANTRDDHNRCTHRLAPHGRPMPAPARRVHRPIGSDQ